MKKQNKIAAALDEITPSASAKQRMLNQILQHEKEKFTMRKPIQILAPLAACLVLAFAAAAMIPQLRAQPPVVPATQANTQANTQVTTQAPSPAANVQELMVELPVMLAGQEIAWENVQQQDGQSFEDAVFALIRMDDAQVKGRLEDGRTITMTMEEYWSGPEAEYEDAMIALRTSDLNYAWTGALCNPDRVNIEVGTIVTMIGHVHEGTGKIFLGHISAID